MRALLAGAGAVEALGGPGDEVEILASFPRAVYVATPMGIAAYVGPAVPSGPLHIQLDVRPTAAGRIDLVGVPTWRGRVPDVGAMARARPLLLEVLEPVAANNGVPTRRAAAALEALGGGDLVEVSAQLGGAGPGLTPAGDDALGGILFALRALGAGEPFEGLVRGVATTPISAAFLLWAARGQALAPVHDLLAAAVAGDRARSRLAARRLEMVGHSSGADFAWGLAQGFRRA